MYRQFGGTALLFVVLSAFVSTVTGGHGHTVQGEGSPVAKTPDTSKNEDVVELDTNRCAVVEILRRHLGNSELTRNVDRSTYSRDDACATDAFEAIDRRTVLRGRVIIATVPDPLQSADELEFDRDIDAIQEAASITGYDFESIFTGWYLSDLEEPKNVKEGREAQHYRRLFGDKSGAMLFHSRSDDNDLLLLLLVPESPTYGINMHAALEALEAVNGLKSVNIFANDSGIGWIGPNYSASAPSLDLLLQMAHQVQFNAFSGSITSGPAIALLEQIDHRVHPEDVTALASDEAALDTLSIAKLFTGGVDSIALLQENESAYGDPISGKGGSPISSLRNVRNFSFPRGIAHVRGIFGKELTNFRPQNTGAAASQDPKSLFDLADTLQQPLDTAPEFAAQSPFSNEGVLAAIAAGIEHMQAAAIVILATDPLDQLFLARYFHQKIPNARLVLVNAERLLPDLRGQYDLDGTITVSRLPLFENSFLQTTRGRHSLTFMNSTQEGVFFAALHQIAALQIVESSGLNGLTPLSTWIGVCSGGSFWPIKRVDDAQPTGGLASVAAANDSAGAIYAVYETPWEPLPELWFVSMSLVLVCAVVHLMLMLLAGPANGTLRNSPSTWARALAHHRILTFYLPVVSDPAEAPCWSREFGRRYWLLTATTQLLLVVNYLLLPAITALGSYTTFTVSLCSIGNFLKTTARIPGSGFALLAAVLDCSLAALFIVLWLNTSRLCFSPSRLSTKPTYLACLLFPIIILGWLGAHLAVLESKLTSDAGLLFAMRCVHLASGVCPVLPLLLCSFGFMIAAAVNLNALALARDRNPGMPRVTIDFVRLGACADRLTSYIECWGLLPNPAGLLLVFSVTVACLVFDPLRMFESFEGSALNWIYAVNFVFGFWTIAWLAVRFLSIWRLLRFVLEALEGSPLRFAFSRLPKVFSLAPIWSYAGLRRTLILPMRWLEYLKVTPSLASHKQHIEEERVLAASVFQLLLNGQVLVSREYAQFSEDQNRYAVELSRQMPSLQTSWTGGGPDASSASNAPKQSSGEQTDASECRTDIPAPCGLDPATDTCALSIANEYIAMRFGAYLRYVTLQLKNLMTFMSLGLLLLLLAAVSYPFRESESIAWCLVIVVAMMLFSVGTVLIQMDRDSLLSRMSETAAGKVDRSAFLWHMLSVGTLPVVTALSALFPSVGNFLFSWLQPLLTSFH